jgi:hypothetical protein
VLGLALHDGGLCIAGCPGAALVTGDLETLRVAKRPVPPNGASHFAEWKTTCTPHPVTVEDFHRTGADSPD